MSRRKRGRGRQKRTRARAELLPESNAEFAFIAGYTEGGAPFGITWDEMRAADAAGTHPPRGVDYPVEEWVEDEELPDPCFEGDPPPLDFLDDDLPF